MAMPSRLNNPPDYPVRAIAACGCGAREAQESVGTFTPLKSPHKAFNPLSFSFVLRP